MCNWRTPPPVLTDKEAAEVIKAVRRDVVSAYKAAIQEGPAYASAVLNHAMHMAVDALTQRQGLADTIAVVRLNNEQLRRDYTDIEQDLTELRNAVSALIAAEDMPPHTPFDGNSVEWDEKFDAEHQANLALRAAIARAQAAENQPRAERGEETK